MLASSRSIGSSILVSCLVLVVTAAPVAAQQPPLVDPAPAAPEFLSRYDFHMTIDRLMPSLPPLEKGVDERFSWDSHFGGSFDLIDYVVGRGTVTVDYEAVMGSEYRPFDPNQGNYALEASLSGRASATTEAAAIFHHVSRHLGDRPKRLGVAWNMLGARFLHHAEAGSTTIDVALEGGRVVARAFVDYTWLGEANLLLRHPFNGTVGAFAHATGQVFAVDEVAMRGTQAGGRIEAGIRLKGRGGVMEIFGGYEKRVDAYPLDRVPQRWGVAGVRLLSR